MPIKKATAISILAALCFCVSMAIAGSNVKKSITSYVGVAASGAPGANTSILNAAPTGASGKQLAFGFISEQAKTIDGVRVYVTAVAGALATTDISVELQHDNAGSPSGTALATTTTVSPALAASTWSNFSGLNYALTAGAKYWLVFKNNNATPTTNYPTLQLLTAALTPWTWNQKYVWDYSSTSNGGTSWSAGYNVSGFRVNYSDSTYDGEPIEAAAVDSLTGYQIYGSNEVGLKMTLPGSASLTYNVVGIVTIPQKTGTPAGSLVFKLYNGATLLASTPSLSNASQTGQYNTVEAGYFSSAVQVHGGDTIRISLADDSADSASNYYRAYYITWDSDANSTPLIPLGGNLWRTYTSDGGSTWTDSASGTFIPAALILDPDTPVSASGSQHAYTFN